MNKALTPIVTLAIIIIAVILNFITGQSLWFELSIIVFLIVFYYYILKKELKTGLSGLFKKFEVLEKRFEDVEKALEKVESKIEQDIRKLSRVKKK